MSLAAILGAGEIGGAIARALALGGRFDQIRLIDADGGIAAGKALDIQQAGPIDRSHVQLEGATDVLASAGASVVIVADAAREGEWKDERALAMLRQLVRAGTQAAIVFAGPSQLWLMETAGRELGIATDRLVGTAAGALVGAVRALVGVELDGSGVDVQVAVVGRPPQFVIGWSSATVAGSLVSDRVAAHRLVAIGESLKRLWPPASYAIAAATAPVAEALAFGSRRLHSAVSILDDQFEARGVAALLPLELGRGLVLRRSVPSLSPRERWGTGLFSTETR